MFQDERQRIEWFVFDILPGNQPTLDASATIGDRAGSSEALFGSGSTDCDDEAAWLMVSSLSVRPLRLLVALTSTAHHQKWQVSGLLD